jgi:outer membrane protein assembly factor BamB
MNRHPGGVAGAALLALGLAAGCTEAPGDSFDGSCGGAHSTVSSLAAANGTQTWQRRLPHPREDAPEAGGGRSGLVLLRGCGVVVLDGTDGRVLARSAEEADVVGVAGRYLVTSDDGDLNADPVTGRGGFGASSQPPYDQAAVAGDLVVAATGDTLAGWRTGEPAAQGWRAELPTAARASVALVGDLLVLRAADGSVYGIGADDGSVRWRGVPGGPALGYGPPLAVAPRAVVLPVGLAPTTEVAALDTGTGAELWRARLTPGSSATGPWATAAGVLVEPGPGGSVGVDLRTGRRVWRSPLDPAGAVGVGGTVVYAAAQDVVGVDARTGRELWRSPTSHRPLLAGQERTGGVVVLDSPPVPHGYDDCC